MCDRLRYVDEEWLFFVEGYDKLKAGGRGSALPGLWDNLRWWLY